jgi:hypothetical protein
MMFILEWDVAEKGYEWKDRFSDPAEAFLAPVAERETSVRTVSVPAGRVGFVVEEFSVKRTRPLQEHSGLFHTLAFTEPTRAGIKAFADTYGFLWYGSEGILRWHHDYVPSYERWVGCILSLRLAVRLWTLVRNLDKAGLASYVHWRGPSEVWIDTCPCYSSCEADNSLWSVSEDFLEAHIHPGSEEKLPLLHVEKKLEPGEYDSFLPGDLIRPAQAYMREIVEQHLVYSLSPRMIGPPSEESLALRFEPNNLLTALWLQFALAITGNKTYHQCLACQTWFELSPAMNRADRLFCSNACRTRAYRQRITNARRLHTQGMELEIIARQLDTDVETVQRWLAKRYPLVEKGRRGRKPKLPYPPSQ